MLKEIAFANYLRTCIMLKTKKVTYYAFLIRTFNMKYI